MKLTDITFHESYGDVSVAQLRAYRRHNVSPSDHYELVAVYGDRHAAITAAVKDTRNHMGEPGQSSHGLFSSYKFRENLNADF